MMIMMMMTVKDTAIIVTVVILDFSTLSAIDLPILTPKKVELPRHFYIKALLGKERFQSIVMVCILYRHTNLSRTGSPVLFHGWFPTVLSPFLHRGQTSEASST